MEFQPAYIKLLESGELKRRVEIAYTHLETCDLCAWKCGVNRRAGQLGVCRTGEKAKVSSYGPHFGEEAPLRGWRGSGTIFFTRCNLRCQYCQNYEISQTDEGHEVEPEELAEIMLRLQRLGCHNINLVSPSHVVAQILAAVLIAAQAGLRLPLVYNTGGYDSMESLQLLDSVIDIYMPDMKYADPDIAKRFSRIPNYPQVNRDAVREMHRQVGDLQVDENGIAVRGLLVRHLVLPNNLAGTETIVQFLAQEISPHTYLNIMDQYYPTYRAHLYPEINRRITAEEFRKAVEAAHRAGLYRLDK
ncbi:radical SAM protein [uncultured Thermanaerothrix sp.]|uniref:radical SAM protein n=1 Tax=uncultured Thermanaerothrix sp. TaxID=1195149 RepID=UPI00262F7277|nr:radical SAM protein [uncultured Thermanaerothrix sp.]